MTSSHWRRALGGVGFVMAVAFLATRGCRTEVASASVRFDVGARGADLRELRAELFRGDDPDVIGYYKQAFDERGSGEVVGPWPLRADPGAYRLEIHMRDARGTQDATRRLEVEDGASITVHLTE